MLLTFQQTMLSTVAFLATFAIAVAAAEPDNKLTANLLRAAMDKPVGRSWQSVPIREAFRELSDATRVSILLDRRLDPSTELSLLAKSQPLRDLIVAAARTVNAESTQVGHVVYVGSPPAVATLRQLLELRSQDWARITSDKTKGPKNPWPAQRAALHKKSSLAWDDLDSPRDVLKQLTERFPIELNGLDQLPHDLWAAGSLPQMSLVESLSLMLFPFGTTFEFVPDRLALNIVPIPAEILAKFETVQLEKPRPSKPVAETGDHSAAKTSRPIKGRTLDVRHRKFTFNVQNAPLRDVLESLRQQGISIVADEQEFANADVPFDKKVDLDVTDQTAEAICRQLVKSLGGEVEVSGNTISLRPKRRQ